MPEPNFFFDIFDKPTVWPMNDDQCKQLSISLSKLAMSLSQLTNAKIFVIRKYWTQCENHRGGF